MSQAELVHQETDVRKATDPSIEAVLAELGAFYPMVSYPAVQEEENGAEVAPGEAFPGLVMQPNLWS
jgi:hypothetical protein